MKNVRVHTSFVRPPSCKDFGRAEEREDNEAEDDYEGQRMRKPFSNSIRKREPDEHHQRDERGQAAED